METHDSLSAHHKKGEASTETTSEEIWSEEDLAAALEPARNPLTNIGQWVKDIALFGASAGSLLGVNHMLLQGGAPSEWVWNFVLGTLVGIPLIALEGALSGFAAGVVLKALRDRVPASLGLGLAAVAGALGACSVFLLDPSRIGPQMLTWTPFWALGVACMIPVTAVRRAQNMVTRGWIMKVGFATGIFMTIARFTRIAIFGA